MKRPRDDILDFYRGIRGYLPQYDAAMHAVLNERWDAVLRQLDLIADRPDQYFLGEGERSRAAELSANFRAWLANGKKET